MHSGTALSRIRGSCNGEASRRWRAIFRSSCSRARRFCGLRTPSCWRATLLLSRRGCPGTTLSREGLRGALEQALDDALSWLVRSQDRIGSGGVGCDELYRWTRGYPEVTGYIIPTMFDAAAELRRPELAERAVRMAEWELRIQRSDGGWEGGYEGDGLPSTVFNTGQVIRGLLPASAETGDQRFLDAAERAGRWIVSTQEPDGSWAGANFKGMRRVYDTYVAAPLVRLAHATGDDTFAEAARRNCAFALTQQQENGWFENADNSTYFTDAPVTHTICYTIDGLLETGELLGDEDLGAPHT